MTKDEQNLDNLEFIIKTKYKTTKATKATQDSSTSQKNDNDPLKEEINRELSYHLNTLLSALPNILFLSGAGTSYKDPNSCENTACYPLMTELLEILRKDPDIKNIIEQFTKANLEEILSNITNPEDTKTVHNKIVSILKEREENHPDTKIHQDFIKKISSFLYKNNRLKIFTTNYDTMFERACQEMDYIVNDGFLFKNNIYTPLSFNYEIVKSNNDIIDYAPNMIHLYKLHGSLTWQIETNTKITCIKKYNTCVENPLIIYPNKNKYENSYDLPYIDMISEFNISLQKPDTLLIICGYSFGDKHINSLIERAFNINNKLHIIIIDPNAQLNKDKANNRYIKSAYSYSNISVIKTTFKNFTDIFLPNKYIVKEENFETKVIGEENNVATK